MKSISNCVNILLFGHLFLLVSGEDDILLEQTSEKVPSTEIKLFTEFLENSLNSKVLHYNIKPLTKPGDNFGAILQAVDVQLFDGFQKVSFL